MISQPRWDEPTGSESAAPGDDGAPQSTEQAIDAVFKHVAEVRDYALLYVETRKDQVKVVLFKVLLYAVLGMLALVVGAGVLAVSVVLLLQGVAGGLARLLGDRAWAGNLITGGGVLLFLVLAIYFGVRGATRSSRRRLGEKYDRRQEELRRRFGREASPRCPVDSSAE
jgi:uncharacterized membrane protein